MRPGPQPRTQTLNQRPCLPQLDTAGWRRAPRATSALAMRGHQRLWQTPPGQARVRVRAAGSPSKAQEAGGAAVPEVLGGTHAHCPESCHHTRTRARAPSVQTHPCHTRVHTASKHARSTAHKHPSHAPGVGVRTGRRHPGLWEPHAVPASWGFLPAGRRVPRRRAACAKVPATQSNRGGWPHWGERSSQGGQWGRRCTSPVGWASGRGTGRGPDAGSGVPGSPVAGPGTEQRPWRA